MIISLCLRSDRSFGADEAATPKACETRPLPTSLPIANYEGNGLKSQGETQKALIFSSQDTIMRKKAGKSIIFVEVINTFEDEATLKGAGA